MKSAVDSGRWVVVEREIKGNFSGPNIVGPFAMDYKANVELATQAGNFRGILKAGEQVLNVNGTIDPLTFVASAFSLTGKWQP